MEADESKPDRSERGSPKGPGKGDEADRSQLWHPEPEVLLEEPDLFDIPAKQGPELPSKRNNSSSFSSSSSSEISPEDPVEVLSGNESRSHSVPLEHDTQLVQNNDVAHSTSTIDLPAMQIMERNEDYNPNRISNSYGGDQAFLLEQEMQTDQEVQKSEELTFNLSQTSAELVDNKNVFKERKSEEIEISQDKIKDPNERIVMLRQDDPKPPNVPLLRTLNSSIQSQGSDSSGYSFSFPIYVSSSALHSSSTKGDSFSPRWIQPKGHHLEAENSVTRQRPPSPHQRTRCCCTRQSWQTCCDLRYWLSFYTCYFCCACLPCYSCCIRCCPCR